MRQSRENQLPLTPLWPDHQHAQELREISKILDENSKLNELVWQDLSEADSTKGAPGMSGEQVLRCGVIKQMHQFSYDRLAFHLADSVSLRAFCRLPLGWTPARSTLAENLSRIRHSTWQAINAALVDWACEQGLEKGEKVRIDATPVESEIHHPTDNQLLCDCVRVLARWLGRLSCFVDFPYRDHGLRARRRCLAISNARRQTLRIGPYRDLLKVSRKMAGYARAALAACQDSSHPRVVRVRSWLEHYLELTDRVIDQTERRVVRGESVPAGQKVVSIFEEHTDLIRKGGRETVYGHKVFLSCGRSSLILDCLPVRGNPADSTYLETMLDRHCHQYGSYPRQASLDGGFASRGNLALAKSKPGLKDVAFAKKRGLTIESMVSSSWVYKQLRRFRAGIEGCISMLKRVFGLDRCHWKGWQHFQQYLQLSTLSYNLLVLARLRL